MFKLKADQLKFPAKLRVLIADEGSYEDDSFAPVQITVSEMGHKGKVVIGYQLSFETGTHFEEIEDMMYDAGLKIDGPHWEELLRKHLRISDVSFEKVVNGDSEGDTCLLWTEKEESFRRLLEEVISFLEDPQVASRVLSFKASPNA